MVFTTLLLQIASYLLCCWNSLGGRLHSLQTWWKNAITLLSPQCPLSNHADSKCSELGTHLAIACAASLVLSFSVFGRGVALGAVASLLSTACPAGQRRGGLADCPLPTRMLCFGRPLKTWQGGRGHGLLFLLQRPLRPGGTWIITVIDVFLYVYSRFLAHSG